MEDAQPYEKTRTGSLPVGGPKRRCDQQEHSSLGRSKKRDLGRAEWGRQHQDKRARNSVEQDRRQQVANPSRDVLLPSAAFSQEEVAAEDRRPKRKVAVMIGYSGTGYKGMQINSAERTIEGDLFAAFVSAGAISKANANDPKKSGLVRCARTDKGVHAAGNVISLKLIIEDRHILQKINDQLSPQIRVWGIQRTTGSFSCYQACDSRWYEYLIPTHSFLPPHPHSYLGRKLQQLAEETGDEEGYSERQEEVWQFWAEAEDRFIKPIMDSLDPQTQELVRKALHPDDGSIQNDSPTPVTVDGDSTVVSVCIATNHEMANEGSNRLRLDHMEGSSEVEPMRCREGASPARAETDSLPNLHEQYGMRGFSSDHASTFGTHGKAVDAAIRELRSAYIAAKKAYRIQPTRLARIRDALSHYVGTKNFHNYTVQKQFRDPSAKRLIKSFVISDAPILIGDVEWLSLKVHGQSFMMHQIRKMVGMAALVVRCGCPSSRILETFGDVSVSIPKAPGLGLLLERPVFDTYNDRVAAKFNRETIDFTKYESELDEFKRREIYERIFREEECGYHFHSFFTTIDNHRKPHFLYLSSAGIAASADPDLPASAKIDTHLKDVLGGDSDREDARISTEESP